jgi:hypothetical protein
MIDTITYVNIKKKDIIRYIYKQLGIDHDIDRELLAETQQIDFINISNNNIIKFFLYNNI